MVPAWPFKLQSLEFSPATSNLPASCNPVISGIGREIGIAQGHCGFGHRVSLEWPLTQRLLDPENDMPYHGGPKSTGNRNNRPPEEGDQIRILFNEVLEKLQILNNSSYPPRMSQWPKGAGQEEFHSTCWRHFTRNIEWTTMTNEDQSQHVTQWLLKKLHSVNLAHVCIPVLVANAKGATTLVGMMSG